MDLGQIFKAAEDFDIKIEDFVSEIEIEITDDEDRERYEDILASQRKELFAMIERVEEMRKTTRIATRATKMMIGVLEKSGYGLNFETKKYVRK